MRKGIYLGSVLAILLFAFIISLNSVSAVAPNFNITAPANNSYPNGNLVFNITSAVNNFNNMSNCSIFVKSPSTNATAWNFIGLILNDSTFESQPGEQVNGTINTVNLVEDSNDYEINVSCTNSSGFVLSKVASGMTFDNTEPTAPALSPSDHTVITSSQTYTFTGAVTDGYTTSCPSYYIYRSGSGSDSKSATGTATYSSTSCSFPKTFSDSTDNGIYYWTITASDGSNTTTSAEGIFEVSITGTSGGLLPGQTYNVDGKTLSIAGNGEVRKGVLGFFQRIVNWFRNLFS